MRRSVVWNAARGVALTAMALMLSSRAEAAWLGSASYDKLHVVTSAQATPAENSAAAAFAANWEAATGFVPTRGTAPDQERVNVWIGAAGDAWVNAAVLEGLGPDGVLLQTLDARGGPPGIANLVLTGAPDRGALYAVSVFFERYMGFRWLTPDDTHIPPPPPELPEIRYTHTPPFVYRDVSYRAYVEHPEFAVAHRLNGFWANAPGELGGHIGYVRGWPGFGHTFHYFVDPEEYFAEHPEYFSEVNGRRIREETQLCLTNPDVLAITIEKVRALLREAPPEQRIVSISQMDWDNWCTCEVCRAIDELEGSHAGTILHFVNSVADAIRGEFPNALVDTFAYTYSSEPPRHVRARDNVVVRLCSIECDFSQPISSARSESNRAFARKMAGWRACTRHLYIWDYTQNWYCFQAPQPNIPVLGPNVRYFARHGADGVFEQASPYSPHSDFEFLKGYILAHCLWDPEVDANALRDEFLALYYREAAPYIGQYLDLIAAGVADKDYELGMYNRVDWLSYELVAHAQELLDAASAATIDPEVQERLKYARLPVQFAALVCPAKLRLEGDTILVDRVPRMTAEAYWDLLVSYGVTHVSDWPLDRLWGRFDVLPRPEHERIRIEKIGSPGFSVWVAPDRGAAVLQFENEGTGTDAFRGVEGIGEDRWRLGDWYAEPDYPELPPVPSGGFFAVMAREANALVLRREYLAGLRVERRIQVQDGAPQLTIRTVYRNVSADPVRLTLRLRAEFSVPGENPLLWYSRRGEWLSRVLGIEEARPHYTGFPPGRPLGVGITFSNSDETLLGQYAGDGIAGAGYQYDPYEGSLTIEAFPGFPELAPGESRTIEVSYTWLKSPPGAEKATTPASAASVPR